MNVLFINSGEPRCGVHQYGRNLCAVMSRHPKLVVIHATPADREELVNLCNELMPDVIIYNWQQGIGGWMAEAPFSNLGRQVLVYHDLEANFDKFDLILFSDPTMAKHDNWVPIGRPLNYIVLWDQGLPGNSLKFGINGFIGGWAINVINEVMHQFDEGHFRLHLPFATYGDSTGAVARASADQCRSAISGSKFTMEVNHEHMSWRNLVEWLYVNDINCYFRDKSAHWRGISSALDAALCARKPIAINECSAFRHMFDCNPSILIEKRKLKDIMDDGGLQLDMKREQYHPDKVAGQVYWALSDLIESRK